MTDKVTAKQQADAELVAETVAWRCSPGSNRDGSPKAPNRHAIIWQAARLGALEYAKMTEADRTNTNAELVEALRDLETAEYEYRKLHDLHGDGDLRTGRAWDRMRRKGDAARKALALYGDER